MIRKAMKELKIEKANGLKALEKDEIMSIS
jgi:hypothetical protein